MQFASQATNEIQAFRPIYWVVRTIDEVHRKLKSAQVADVNEIRFGMKGMKVTTGFGWGS